MSLGKPCEGFITLNDENAVKVLCAMQSQSQSLLEYAARCLRHPTCPEELTFAKIQIAAFLEELAFGIADSMFDNYNECFIDYYKKMQILNSAFIRVLLDRDDVDLLIRRRSRKVRFTNLLNLAAVRGLTTVVPLTEKGYHDYMNNIVSEHAFIREHVAPCFMPYGDRCYVYIEGLFYLLGGGSFETNDSDAFSIEGVERRKSDIVIQLFQHIASVTPRLFRNDFDEISTVRTCRLPIFICNTYTKFGEILVRKAGFVRRGEDKDKHPRYELDLAEYNQLEAGSERKKAIRKVVCILQEQRGRREFHGS